MLLRITSNFLKNGYINKTAGRVLVSYGHRKYTAAADPDAPIELDKNPYAKEQIKCILCRHNIVPDYKNVQLMSQFQSPYTGRIYGKHITGLCKARQEQVEREIIKAQNAGLMATYHKAVQFLNDPKLFDPEKPSRPHKY
ncbi:28S ribosomal protein S18c, mitochondrial [Toxorhynchites rutilus septentrionalis]|uniref:28S ribosomal protein S18c, mitochondrial n=1 Tax=Toxorhynchites rutilus septentrionalis TaxID=329112 RepID=UPI00247A1B54|nr:28S ribosomal protein S18c, mitochondrial [Toxorhynchites rutilus septentrionalis]